MSRLRGLVLTNLFATPEQPTRATFNQLQFAQWQGIHDLLIAVPLPQRRPVGRASNVARIWKTAAGSTAIAFPVWHPPIIGRALNAWLLHRAARAQLRRHFPEWRPQFVLGSFGFPDGVAATLLARSLGVPAIIKLHGSDINTMARGTVIRVQLRWAFRHAAGVVAVSRALLARMRELGLQNPHTELVYNGVDKSVFRPQDRQVARASLGLPSGGRCILYVGNLKLDKGVLDLLHAFEKLAAELPDVALEFVGSGPAAEELQRAIDAAGLGERVHLRGNRPYEQVPQWMSACDILCLPSHAEGVPNVVVEAQACGRPVVASSVGGIPEVVPEGAGLLVPPQDVDALCRALVSALGRAWDTDRIVRDCPLPTWQESAQRLADFVANRTQGARG